MPELPGQSFVLQGVEYGFQMPLDLSLIHICIYQQAASDGPDFDLYSGRSTENGFCKIYGGFPAGSICMELFFRRRRLVYG